MICYPIHNTRSYRQRFDVMNQPLPLPESMQHEFSPVVAGMGMEFRTEWNPGNGLHQLQHQSQQSQPSSMQLNVNDPPALRGHTCTVYPLSHCTTWIDHSTASLSPVGRTMFAANQVNTQGTMFRTVV